MYYHSSIFLQPFFFEVMIVNTGRNKEIAVGLSTRSSKLELFPGWQPNTFGYHGDDGNVYYENPDDPVMPETEKPFKSGDVIGVTLDQSGSLAFFKNAKHIKTVQLTREHMAQELYASVGISSPGGIVRAVHMSGAAAAGEEVTVSHTWFSQTRPTQ